MAAQALFKQINLPICDRPCKKMTIVGKNVWGDFYRYHFYLALYIFAENMVACCIAKIRLLLCLVDRKHIKIDNFVCVIGVDNFPHIFIHIHV